MSLFRKEFKFKLKDIKVDQEKQVATISGHASTFGNEDLHGDIVERGAFSRTIQNDQKKPLLAFHNTDEPIGATTKLEEDDKGLYFEADILLSVQRGKELADLLKMGAIKGISIGFQILKKLVDETTGIRRLLEIKLWEVSVVTFPANPQASVTTIKDIENETHKMAVIKSGHLRDMVEEAHVDVLQYCKEPEAGSLQKVVKSLGSMVDECSTLREALVKAGTSGPVNEEVDPGNHSDLVDIAKALKEFGGR